MKKILLFDLLDRPLEIKANIAKDLIYSGQIKQYIDAVGLFNHTRNILISSDDHRDFLQSVIGEINAGTLPSDSCQLTNHDGKEFLSIRNTRKQIGENYPLSLSLILRILHLSTVKRWRP